MAFSLSEKAPLIYDSEYFSGTQASIYIGDIWVDEITGIQFEVIHAKSPIYGYASQFWDAMARGVVMVRGSFTINFKEAGYMFLALAEYQRKRQGLGRVKGKTAAERLDDYKFGGATVNEEVHPYLAEEKMVRWNVERAIDLPDDDPAKYKMRQDIAGFASEAQAQGGRGLDRAEGMMEAFEDAIWGKNREGGANTAALMQAARRADDHRLSGFDIYVQLGDFSNNLANHTMNKIVNCHINGQSRVIAADDEPIMESYSFIAQTIL